MGILNVFRLANDYNKAKRLLRENKPNIDKLIKVYLSLRNNINKFKDFYKQAQGDIKEFIDEGIELLNNLKRVIGKNVEV